MNQAASAPTSENMLSMSRRRLLIAVCAIVAILLAGVGFGDESVIGLHKDAPRHVMNGVFVHDLLHDRPFHSLTMPIDYARHYFARYPGLSIGHHPLLPPVLQAAGHSIVGVSVAGARAASILFFVLAVVFLFRLVTQWSDEWSGTVAALVLATSPVVWQFSLGLMDEIQALAFLVMAAFYVHRFTVEGRGRSLAIVALLIIAAAWSKQISIAAIPAFACYIAARMGPRRILRRDVVIAAAVMAVAVAPLIPLTLWLSPYNVGFVKRFASEAISPGRLELLQEAFGVAFSLQLSWPVWLLAALGLAMAARRHRPLAWMLGPWILATVVVITFLTVTAEPERYGIYWLPAWAACAGLACAPDPRERRRALGLCVLAAAAITYQVWAFIQAKTPRVRGYEEVARQVVEQPRGSSILFVGGSDSGLFQFFVRKHDRERRAIVLRADKLLTTSLMNYTDAIVHIKDRAEIPALLERYGVGYVVAEDWGTHTPTIGLMYQELNSPRFTERRRVRVESTDLRINGRDLVVYERLQAKAADPAARLELRLPLVSQEIGVAMSDLINRKYFRP